MTRALIRKKYYSKLINYFEYYNNIKISKI